MMNKDYYFYFYASRMQTSRYNNSIMTALHISFFSRLENCPTVSDASSNSGEKRRFPDEYSHAAAEKLLGPKPTVLVLGIIRSPRSVDSRWRQAETVDTKAIIV